MEGECYFLSHGKKENLFIKIDLGPKQGKKYQTIMNLIESRVVRDISQCASLSELPDYEKRFKNRFFGFEKKETKKKRIYASKKISMHFSTKITSHLSGYSKEVEINPETLHLLRRSYLRIKLKFPSLMVNYGWHFF